MSDRISVSHLNRICEIGIDRPEKKNALTLEMYSALAGAINEAVNDHNVRVILLHGSSECFTSGNDLGDFARLASAPETLASPDNPILRFMRALQICPKPVVCAVQGLAAGIGTTLLLHCDLNYAAPQTLFSVPFASLGLCPEFAASLLLPQLAGYPRAAEWLLLGEAFSAEQALDAGLLNAIDSKPLEYARQQSLKLAAQPPQALRRTKRLLRDGQRCAVNTTIYNEIREFAEGLQGPEFAEAVAAFMEKRTPDFSQCN